ncbi:MAG TPA: hypothetical protein VKX29_02865 [Brumimicrobium sp.]|nr:hypothetical protein [Brumimicrobium sp.]
METVTKIFLLILIIIFRFSTYSQKAEIYATNNILFYEESLVNESDSLFEFRISSKAMHDGKMYLEQTLSILYHNDSIIGYDFERNPNYGREFTIKIEDSCKNYSYGSVDYLNSQLRKIIFKLMSDGQSKVNSIHPKDAKLHFDLLQKLILIINSEQTDFLIDYCKYINMDLLTLELEFVKAKNQKNKKILFFVSQAYRMNNYNQVTKIAFDDMWLELADKNGYHKMTNLFNSPNLKKLDNVLSKKMNVFKLNQNCVK